jgi:hypothetical protein
MEEPMVPGETRIWRYMDFVKFVSMVQTHSLFFPRPCTFDDPWDGHYPPSYLKNSRPVYGLDEKGLQEDFERRYERRRYGFFVSCWMTSDEECLAMWKLYGASPEGIAIQSTIQDARHSLQPDRIGSVIYYNPNDDIRHKVIIGTDDIQYKRHYFQFEREFRMWCLDEETLIRLGRGQPPFDATGLAPGKPQHITDMPTLIHRVVIAPAASDLFFKTVKELCVGSGKSWLAGRVCRSSYDLRPSDYSG